MAKSMQRFLLACVLFVAGSSANAGELFGPLGTRGPVSLERLSMADYHLAWLALAETPLASFSSAYTSVSVTAPKPATAPRYTGPNETTFNDWSNNRLYTTGEIGLLYGRSTGRHGLETEQGYIFGQTGNDKIQISVGASYQEWTVRGARGR